MKRFGRTTVLGIAIVSFVTSVVAIVINTQIQIILITSAL